ncbi:heat shock protein DDB_G0288861 isoform X5 [Lates calcarifer]|uniref:Heat shock protein DDB_G0288861 isoform X5 n=1 Tax=Lates calcarifer TaxID=8187 RepID=A0AAJ7PL23_LATCA|nr:heat shock protein DDB_G0288861 isoform X5 [Lates calcarifer]
MSTEEAPLFEKPPSDKESESELRIVLLGVVEEGKSSSGNMILSPSGEEKPFSTKCPPSAVSKTIDKNPDQVTDLLKKITHMIEMRRGTYYTTEMLQEAETALKQQQKQQQQQVQQQVQQQPQQQAQNQTGQNNTTRTAIGTFALFGTGAGSLMGFFFGGGEMTPPVGAALGAVAGGLLVAGTTGLTLLAKNAFHKCCGKNSDCF